MRSRSAFLAILISTVLVSACDPKSLSLVTGGFGESNNPADRQYGIFFSPADHVTELLEQDKIDEAQIVYNSNRASFLRDKELNRTSQSALADKQRVRYAPESREIIGRLAALQVGTDPAGWPDVRQTLLDAKALAVKIKDSILGVDAYHAEFLDELENATSETERKIKSVAEASFAEFPLPRGSNGEGANFFSSFPIEVTFADFGDAVGLTRKRLANASISEIEEFFRVYRASSPSAAREAVSEVYFERQLSLSNGGNAPSLKAIISAISALRQNEMPVTDAIRPSVTFVDLTSPSLIRDGQIEFPVSIKMDLPFEAKKATTESLIESINEIKTDVIVAIDIVVAKNSRRLQKQERVSSELQTGTSTQPNPSYAIVQNEVNQANVELQGAMMNSASANSQYCYGMGCLGKAIAQLAAGAAEGKARDKVGQAMTRLRNTPMMVQVPVYAPYEFNKVDVEAAKSATVHYYVIDRAKKSFFKDTFDAQKTEKFVVLYNISKDDRNLTSHLSEAQTEDDVKKFDEGAIEVSLSSILSQFEARPDSSATIPANAQIRADILNDRNRALDAAKATKFTALPTVAAGGSTTAVAERNLESVVVVINPKGGLGSGFYVKDDIVLTNNHVIEGAQFIEMKLRNGLETFGKVIAKDIRLDLALVKVEARGVPVAFFTGQNIPLGETVFAVGHPKGLEFSVSRGVISAVREISSTAAPGGKKVRFIQTDAAINPGNSGGPLFLGTSVVGINTQKLASADLQGLGFAVHYSEVLEFLRENKIASSTQRSM